MGLVIAIFANIIIWGILIYILIWKNAKRSAPPMSKNERFQTVIMILVCFSAIIGYIIFFDDAETIFTCDKETNRCQYIYATIANPTRRLAYEFHLNDIREIEIAKERKRSGKYSHKTVYRIVYHLDSDDFKFPHTFDYQEEAIRELGKFQRFLTSNRNSYGYYKGHAPDGFDEGLKKTFYIMIGLILTLIGYKATRKKIKEL